MKRKTMYLAAFALFAFAALLFGVYRYTRALFPGAPRAARTVIPRGNDAAERDSSQLGDERAYDETKSASVIPLLPEESFIQALSVDLNRDGQVDQVIALKRAAEPNVYLVAAIHNPLTGQPERVAEIKTGVTQVRTLAFYAMDVVGDRSNALVYSGMTQENLQLLAVYLPATGQDGKTALRAVADLRSDGPIAVQEVRRSEAYNLGLTNGDSYPIYAYHSDPESPQTLSQIERVYRWDANRQRYELASEAKIAGKKIESQILRQLQGGNLEAFEDFLSGLWFRQGETSSDDARYVFFNLDDDDILFHSGSTEEIFLRESGAPRRYGVYFSSRNRSIPSIRRLIDIELTGIDEIRVKVFEDVRLKIGVASDWDGNYRKMAGTVPARAREGDAARERVSALLAEGGAWASGDGQELRLDGGRYTLSTPAGVESGGWALVAVKGRAVLQMKGTSSPSRFYLVEEPKDAVGQVLILTPVRVSIDGTEFLGPPPIRFERGRLR